MADNEQLVIVRGGGDIASGTIYRLHKSGFRVTVLETDKPTMVRRTVSFGQAVYDGEITIDGVRAILTDSISEISTILDRAEVPVIVDPEGLCIPKLKPVVVVDAILAKRNLGTDMDMAPIVIGLGPGFEGGNDVHAVIETNRGHDLGKVIHKGSAVPDTGIPGSVQGFSEERVIRAEGDGRVKPLVEIGETVKQGDPVARIGDKVVNAAISGVVRGLVNSGLEVTDGLKIGDIDPRNVRENCFSISDKALSIAGGVLEAILYLSREKDTLVL